MASEEKTGARAGQAFDCGSNHSTLDKLTDEQRTLVSKMASITDMIEGHRTTMHMLERERLQLQTRLRLTGWRPPAPCGGGE
jgi:hypothetical protein